MDPATAKMLFQLGTYGPLGVMVILLFILLLRQQKETKEAREECSKLLVEERGKNIQLADKLVELSRESIKADTEHTETIRAMTKVLDSIDRRLA
jgi:hypothetical protein